MRGEERRKKRKQKPNYTHKLWARSLSKNRKKPIERFSLRKRIKRDGRVEVCFCSWKRIVIVWVRESVLSRKSFRLCIRFYYQFSWLNFIGWAIKHQKTTHKREWKVDDKKFGRMFILCMHINDAFNQLSGYKI